MRARIAHSGRRRFERRDADLEIHLQPHSDFSAKSAHGNEAVRISTGYRAFSRELLEKLPLEKNSDDFLFDNQILAQIFALGYPIAEVTCPTKYFPEASSINFWRSLKYGLGCLATGVRYRFSKSDLIAR